MTKTKLGQSDAKPSEYSSTPLYSSVQVIDGEQPQEQVDLPGTNCWYVWGIISTLCCCLPCGVIGLVHAMIAKHEGERGNYAGYRNRIRGARFWTGWSIALGLLTLFACILYTIHKYGGFSRVYAWCKVVEVDPLWRWNDTLDANIDWNATATEKLVFN